MKILMIINMNDLYKIQYKCKKKIVREKLQYQIRHVASFMKVVWGGGQPDSNILGKHKKERSSNTGIMKIVIREKGGELNFLFLQFHSCFFLFSLQFLMCSLKKCVLGEGTPL